MSCSFSVLRSIRFLLAMLFLSASLLSIQSCRVEESAAEGGEGSGDTTDDGSEDLALTSFKVYAESEDASYSLYATKDGDGETPCIPTEDDKDITCVIDMEELDLFQRGLTIKVDIPGKDSENNFQCSYLYEHPYYYRVAPLSLTTPSRVYIAELDGDLVDPADNAGADYPIDGGTADIYYIIGGVEFSHLELYGRAASGASDLRCPWDYSKVGTIYEPPNCCVGWYTKYQATLSATEDPAFDTSSSDWGGTYDECLAGSGVLDWPHRTEDGIPEYLIHNIPLGGKQHEFVISPPINTAREFQTHATNYFSGEMPSPLADGNPYYLYGCLDHNQEYLYRIKVQVREWNKAGELAKLVAGAAADPDSSGCESTPFGMMSINDHSDWGDYQDAIDPGFLLTSYDFSLASGDSSPVILILNAYGYEYTASSRFLFQNTGGWGIDSCP